MDSIDRNRSAIAENLLAAIVSFDALKFEKLVLALLTVDGSTGSLTTLNSDNGIDVEVNSPEGLIVAQCKAYSGDSRVSPKEVREFLGAVTHVEAIRGYFFTTSWFTAQARAFAEGHSNLVLIDRNDLEELLVQSLFSAPSNSDGSRSDDNKQQEDELCNLRMEVTTLRSKNERISEDLDRMHKLVLDLESKLNGAVTESQPRVEMLSRFLEGSKEGHLGVSGATLSVLRSVDALWNSGNIPGAKECLWDGILPVMPALLNFESQVKAAEKIQREFQWKANELEKDRIKWERDRKDQDRIAYFKTLKTFYYSWVAYQFGSGGCIPTPQAELEARLIEQHEKIQKRWPQPKRAVF